MAESRRRDNDERTRAELVTLTVSVAVLVALVAALVYAELQFGAEPVRVEVQLDFDAAERHGDEWYLPVTARNVGDRTSERLVVRIEQQQPGDDPVQADLEFDFVSGGERVEGTAVLPARPAAATTTGVAISSVDP